MKLVRLWPWRRRHPGWKAEQEARAAKFRQNYPIWEQRMAEACRKWALERQR